MPLAILSEHPDSASPNLRKMAMTAESVPDNCCFVRGVCGAHQGHRIVYIKERECVGDIYAIAVSLSNGELQNKCQVSLKNIIEKDLVFLRGSSEITRGPRISKCQWQRWSLCSLC